jgi:hypothetical protein
MSRKIKLLTILIAVATIAAYIIMVVIPSELAKRSYQAAKTLGEDFTKAFQFTPEIIVNNTIVLNQQTSVLELAVLSQNFEHRYAWSNTWLNSTKEITITGTFEAKAGFDLNERFSILLEGDKAIVTLPEPKILSVESQGDISYRDANGVWNWVNADDRTQATNAFIQDARAYAAQAAFVSDAKKQMEEKLNQLLKPHASEVVIHYSVALPPNQ